MRFEEFTFGIFSHFPDISLTKYEMRVTLANVTKRRNSLVNLRTYYCIFLVLNFVFYINGLVIGTI